MEKMILRLSGYIISLLIAFGLGYLAATGQTEIIVMPNIKPVTASQFRPPCPTSTIPQSTFEPINEIAQPNTLVQTTPPLTVATSPETHCPPQETPTNPEWQQIDIKVQDMLTTLQNRELSPELRATAVQFLAMLDTPSAQNELQRILFDGTEELAVRAEVMRYGDWTLYDDSLLDILEREPEEQLRKLAVYSAQRATFDDDTRARFDQILFNQFNQQVPEVQKAILDYFTDNGNYFPLLMETVKYGSEEVVDYAENILKQKEQQLKN